MSFSPDDNMFMIQSIDKHKNFTKTLKNPMGSQTDIMFIDYSKDQGIDYVAFGSEKCVIVWNIDNFTVAGYCYSEECVVMMRLCMGCLMVGYDNGRVCGYQLV